MANFVEVGDNYKIGIPYWKSIDKNTFYVIKIDVAHNFWTVSRRYSEFAKLHQTLVAEHGVLSDALPPKKIIGSKDEQFIEERRVALDEYLRNVVRFLQKTMPKELALFLNFYQFDVVYIVKSLAVKFYPFGEIGLSKTRSYKLTAIELFAINERLKQPCNHADLIDKREDFSHVLDFCYQMTELTLAGSDEPREGSNMVPNKFPLSFGIFKKLEVLNLQDVNSANMTDLGSLRTTLKHITADRCYLKGFADLLLCDQLHKSDLNSANAWKELKSLKIAKSQIVDLDQSLTLLPNLKQLVLDDNQIHALSGLNILSELVNLSVRMNRLHILELFEANKLVFLDLSENWITSLAPFSSLCRLETLNLQMNRICDITEMRHIAMLPYLENVVLTGNPVSQIIDYRVKVLEYFSGKAYRICLDNESPTQKELDKVAILAALHSSTLKDSSLAKAPP